MGSAQDYASECQKFLLDGGRHVSVSTHADVIEIASKICQDHERTSLHHNISEQPRGSTASAASIDGSLNLCSRLLLMVSVGEPPQGIDGPNIIRWDAGSLRAFTETYFGAGTGIRQLQPDKPQIGRIFTALNLRKIGGMRIEWTRNLADHLRLIDDDTAVSIFDCVAFLRFQQKLDTQLFPPNFITETLQTLSLLLPQNDPATQSWLSSEIASSSSSTTFPSGGGGGRGARHNCHYALDTSLSECGSLTTHERRFESFVYWSDRLVVLRQALDEARPRTLAQWWHDRRNGVQWYTFWVAILVFLVTIFFGLVQSLEGALQVWLSWKALAQG